MIKWNNVFKAIVLVLCIYTIGHDVIMMIGGAITGHWYSWTAYGFITFLIASALGGNILDDFIEEVKGNESWR